VAKRLGVSQRHVSRVLAAALKRLSTHLRPGEGQFEDSDRAEGTMEEVREP
jgi:DNA-binding transcriptional regulator LsrR (DeoR family)